MAIFGVYQDHNRGDRSPAQLLVQLQDYATVGKNLFWQRQTIFAAALLLASYYYSLTYALITCVLIVLAEANDYYAFQRVLSAKSSSRRELNTLLLMTYFGTMASAGIISFYSIWISLLEGHGTHFMALFFLFAAALFAAMNNHHLISVLVLRLVIYGAAFLFIPIYDIVATGAPLTSELWSQLFTSVFVVYFIIDCSRIYLNFYRLTRKQMSDLTIEHEKTKEALRIKSEFLATMSHELRTPITAIKASVDMANSGKLGELPPKATNVLTVAQRNCAKLISLIDEVLDLQKIESGQMAFTFEPVELGALVKETLDANVPFAEKYNVELQYIPGATPETVRADHQKISQVLTNLLSNAVKFSPKGSLVRVKITGTTDSVRIVVIDEGIGVPEQDRERIFDRFTQAISSDKKADGTGLGLNISKRIIEAHDGAIGFTNNTGPGCTFYVDLKREGPKPATQQPAANHGKAEFKMTSAMPAKPAM